MSDIQQKIFIFVNRIDLYNSVAEMISETAQDAINSRGIFHLSLAGGSTPEDLYRTIAAHENGLDWRRIHVWFGDERCVAADDPLSNFRMAKETLLSHLNIPTRNIHRIPCEYSPDEAAIRYENELGRFKQDADTWFRFDLVLLGLGGDGHTASLFPDNAVLEEKSRSVAPVFVEDMHSWRVTLTIPVLNAARKVVFLVSGENKAHIVAELLGSGHADQYPAGHIKPTGELLWCLDSDAAQLLPKMENN